MRFILILIGYALISAYGLYLLKASSDILSVKFLIGGIFYGTGFLVWVIILRLYPLSLAFPVAAGMLIVSTQLFGIFLLGEQSSWQSLTGTGLIMSGIVLMHIKALE